MLVKSFSYVYLQGPTVQLCIHTLKSKVLHLEIAAQSTAFVNYVVQLSIRRLRFTSHYDYQTFVQFVLFTENVRTLTASQTIIVVM